MTMSDDICGAETAKGNGCQLPASRDDGRCHMHTGDDPADVGRPAKLDDENTRQRVLVAVGQGLKVTHQASLAGISPDTLRRGLCCITSPRDPELDADPCEFCANYAQAHADGAREVLQDCRPEFVASASYGYVETEGREITGEGGDPVDVNVNFTE